MRQYQWLLALLLLATSTILPGCDGGGSRIRVTGNLLKGGSPYVPPPNQKVSVTFVALEVKDGTSKKSKSNDAYWVEIDQAQGTFSVPGPDGKGIPPGKYRVAVTQKMTREAYDAKKSKTKKGIDPGRDTDTLGNKFGLDTSPIVREVTQSGAVVIDLDKPNG